MLLENLLNELKATLKSIKIKKVPKYKEINDIYKLLKDDDIIYKDDKKYFFKIRGGDKTKRLFKAYDFLAVMVLFEKKSNGAYEISFDTIPSSDYALIQHGKPIEVMRKVGAIIKNRIEEKSNEVYLADSMGARMKMYKSFVKSEKRLHYRESGSTRLYFSTNKDKLEDIKCY